MSPLSELKKTISKATAPLGEDSKSLTQQDADRIKGIVGSTKGVSVSLKKDGNISYVAVVVDGLENEGGLPGGVLRKIVAAGYPHLDTDNHHDDTIYSFGYLDHSNESIDEDATTADIQAAYVKWINGPNKTTKDFEKSWMDFVTGMAYKIPSSTLDSVKDTSRKIHQKTLGSSGGKPMSPGTKTWESTESLTKEDAEKIKSIVGSQEGISVSLRSDGGIAYVAVVVDGLKNDEGLSDSTVKKIVAAGYPHMDTDNHHDDTIYSFGHRE